MSLASRLELSSGEARAVMEFVAADEQLAGEWDLVGELFLLGLHSDVVLHRMQAILQKAYEIRQEALRCARDVEAEKAGQQ